MSILKNMRLQGAVALRSLWTGPRYLIRPLNSPEQHRTTSSKAPSWSLVIRGSPIFGVAPLPCPGCSKKIRNWTHIRVATSLISFMWLLFKFFETFFRRLTNGLSRTRTFLAFMLNMELSHPANKIQAEERFRHFETFFSTFGPIQPELRQMRRTWAV